MVGCNHKFIAVKSGIITTQQINSIKSNKIYRLRGDLKFYPNQLLTTKKISTLSIDEGITSLFEQPWTHLSNPIPASSQGSYHIRIEPSEKNNPLSLFVGAQSSCSMIYVNDKLLYQIGNYNFITKKISERFYASYFELPHSDEPLEVVIFIANKNYKQGGLDEPLFIGETSSIRYFAARKISISSFTIGALFILALYLFLLVISNKKLVNHFYLACFSMAMILYLLTPNNYLIMQFLPNLSAKMMLRLGILSYTTSGVFVMLFIGRQYKNLIQVKWISYSFIILCTLLTLITLFTRSSWVFNQVILTMHFLSIMGSIYITILFIKAIHKKQVRAWIYLILWVAFSFSVVFDILNSVIISKNGGIGANFSAGIIVFIIGHTFILASNFGEIKRKFHQLDENFQQELSMRTQALTDVNNSLQTEITIDVLTGLFNRTRLIQMQKNDSKLGIFSILFIDLDNFKHINDNWGHNAGDIVLIEVANLIKREIRPDDIPIRFGGDEFVLILPNTPVKGAAILAQRIITDLEKQKAFAVQLGKKHIIGKKNIKQTLTCSIGIAQQLQNETIHELILQADHALLNAKRKGKNECLIYSK